MSHALQAHFADYGSFHATPGNKACHSVGIPLIFFAVLAAAGRLLPVSAALVLFVLGWVLQFVGHYVYEKKSPAFFRNVTHLLVGPLWILAKATGRG